jgi:outer membrane protein TolC
MAALLVLTPSAALLAQAGASRARTDTLRLSVQDAVALADRLSDEARLAAAEVDVADAQVATARSSGLPQIRLNSSYSHTYESARGNAVGQVFNQPNTYNVNASITQTLFQGGRIVASSRAASDFRAASRLDERETRALLNVSVQRAYLNALYNARLSDIQQSNLTLADARLRQIEKLQGAGQAARYDVLRVRVERSNLEPLAMQAENDRELAVLDLKRMLNIPVDQPVALTTTIDPAGIRGMIAQFASLEDTVLVPDRAAVRSAELNASARHHGIAVARADFLPTASISFNTGYQAFPPLGFGLPDRMGTLAEQYCPPNSTAGRVCQNGGWFADRALTATISFPLFDGLRAKSNLDLAQAQARIADLQLQQQREAVSIEVARARAELRRSRLVFEARQQNSSEAQEAFQLASLRYSRGLSTQLEVSDAQFAFLTAQSGEARATYDLYLATAELARALGRPIPFPPGSEPTVRRTENGAKGDK